MKKLLAVVLSLCMLFTAFGVVAAAEEETTTEINWEDFESQVEEAGWEGEFVTFDEIAVQIWVPTALEAYELTDEDTEGGIIGYYENEEGTAALRVTYVDVEGMELDEYAELQQEEYGATEVEDVIINGIPMVGYLIEDSDVYYVSIATEAGYILEFGFTPMSDESFAAVAAVMMASIQAVEE